MVSAAYRSTILQVAAPDNLRGRLQGVFTVVVAGGPGWGTSSPVRPRRSRPRRSRSLPVGSACIIGVVVAMRLATGVPPVRLRPPGALNHHHATPKIRVSRRHSNVRVGSFGWWWWVEVRGSEAGGVDGDPDVLGPRRAGWRRGRTGLRRCRSFAVRCRAARRRRRTACRSTAAGRTPPSSVRARAGGARGPTTSLRDSPTRPRRTPEPPARRRPRPRARGRASRRTPSGRAGSDPGVRRSPSPTARSVPHTKQFGKGWS